MLARLDGVQRSMSNQPRADLIRLNKKLQNELQEILLQEELLWFQRSREDWITSGDWNTKYYHAATATKNSASKVTRIKDDNDNWLVDKADILSHIKSYFLQLFCEENVSV